MDAAPAVTSLEAPPVSTRATVHRLGNGLTVLVEPRHEVPVVALNVTYVVGSRHESAGRRGIAHLFEHLMFQGSAHVAPGEHAAILEGLGAAFNATTSFDRTWYYETVPVHALETALWLEADRMATLPQALSQTELDAQREVVGNERLQTMVNVPYGELMAHVLELALPQESPYALLPIGRMEELAEATIADLASDLSDPGTRAEIELNRLLYPAEDRSSRPYAGTAESVSSLTREDVLERHQTLVASARRTLVTAGPISAAELATIVARSLRGVSGLSRLSQPGHDVVSAPAVPTARSSVPSPASDPNEAIPAGSVHVVDRPGATKTAVQAGVVTGPLTQADRAVMRVASHLLTDGMRSRLNIVLREEKG